MKILGALLAAGSSRRLGEAKQLLELEDGTCLVQRAAQVMLDSQLTHVGVVVDAKRADVSAALAELSLELLPSPAPREGMAASIRAATHWASSHEADALLLCVCDQPLLTSDHLDRLVTAFSEELGLAASYYDGKPGVPAVFPARYFPRLSELRGDSGAASILRQAHEVSLVAWPEGAIDLDSPADLASWQARQQGNLAI